ncbi:glycerol-3-phosphate 1-O-acyltransferase PlsY [Candidatus Symbiobacter mobilis]|uniref:Glycerol-3-phosphate acyltransferase n=1 Tax=Candidatus Symbiobacter mobilis CR TaxID=946483 RepID=U5N884_9BURK|nr:glycerol-3-phosphate 1-O-acyltransferase PlsY [Candidatus Symbiobacter mobilis]AGX87612.1 glycerol-3-phosphate acyltransferase PlsY [Candidatus Symbiobacter mobilis CR]
MSSVDPVLLSALAALLAYLLGSVSFAVVISRALGLADPRSYGSRNPGATNVLRSGSKAAAAATLLLDVAKGWLPVACVVQWGGGFGLHGGVVAVVGVAAFLGHVYPVFFRFVGGKGVATALGVLLGWSLGWGLGVALCWLVVAGATRYSSLASVAAAVLAPVVYWVGGAMWWGRDVALLLGSLCMAVMLLWRHRANLRRLLAGQEPRIGSKGRAHGAAPASANDSAKERP